MKFLDEYRDADIVRDLGRRIGEAATRDWTIMEVCGGQTHPAFSSLNAGP